MTQAFDLAANQQRAHVYRLLSACYYQPEAQFLEEDVGHVGVVMLAGMDEDFGDIPAPRDHPRDGGGLDELRAGTDDSEELH